MSADLSGPHDLSPCPGGPVGSPLEQSKAAYFLVVVFQPEEDDEKAEPSKERAVYAAVFRTKDETFRHLKRLISQCQSEIGAVKRLHTDLGTEFVNERVETWCIDRGIFRTYTQGHDPNSNGLAEKHVDILKGVVRTLLVDVCMDIAYWAMAILAAAYRLRVHAGYAPPPAFEFGSQVLCVPDPLPRSAFAQRARPGLVFGPTEITPTTSNDNNFSIPTFLSTFLITN